MKKESLRALQLKWYKKLRDEGFVDIEAPIHAHTEARHSTWYIPNKYTADEIAATQRYYELAAQMVHDYTFSSKTEKKIWTLHSQGLSYNAIAKQMKLKSQTSVQLVVERIAKCIKTS